MAETQDRKFDVIQRPPKIYLDTNHLINIADVRKGKKLPPGQSEGCYRRLDDCIRSYCGLIFNPIATMDWVGGKASTQSISEIAAVVDSANLKYVALDADFFVYTREILDQCRKQNPSIHVPDLPPILQNVSDNSTILSPLHIIMNHVSEYLEKSLTEAIEEQGGLPNEIPVFTVVEWVNEIFKQRLQNPKNYQSRTDSFIKRFNYDIEHKDEYFRNPNHHRLEWFKKILKVDKILKAFNPKINVDNILEKIDIKGCPAIDLLWKFHEIRMKNGNLLRDENDVDDYMFIPIVPYADVMLIETKFKGTIVQADNSLKSKVFSKVSDALNALENQGFTW